MTLVLKSNNAASNTISDKHGLLAAKDWKLMLDFENESYIKQSAGVKTSVALESYLETSNENAFIRSKDNKYSTLAKNTLRLSMNEKGDAFGLYEESGFTELYSPTNAPISKNVNLYQGALVGPYVVRMKGSGSVKITGTNITNVSNSTVTEKNACSLYSNGASTTPVLSLEIVGEVTFLSVIAVGLASSVNLNNSMAEISTSTWWFKSAITKLITSKAAELLASKTNFTVLIQCIDNEYLTVSGASTGIYKPLFELIGQTGHMSVIKRRLTPTAVEELAVRLYDGTETIVTMSSTKRSSVIALTSGSDGVKIAMDGKVTNPSGLLQGFTVSDLLVGSSSQWYTSGNTKAQGVITKLAVYDRQLTSDELTKATLSFQ